MWFQIQREALLKPLQLVVGAVEKKQSMPILSNIKLEVLEEGAKLSLTATDLEIELIAHAVLPAHEKTKVGAITVPARKLMDICRALPEGALLDLQQEGNRVVLLSNRSRFTLAGLPVEGFPSIQDGVGTVTFAVPAVVLRQLLEQVSFSMAQQDVRYYLNGLLFVFEPTGVRAVATDGHRLATLWLPATLEALTERYQVILPRKAVVEFAKLLSETDVEVVLTLSAHHLRMSALHYSFSTKLIDGKFPNYSQVIPKNTQHVTIAKRELLRDALMRASVLFSDKFRGAGLLFKENTLTIVASNQDKDEAEIDLEIEYEGPPLEIGFNISYIIEYLGVIKTPLIKIGFSEPNASVLFEAVGAEGYSLYIVMPMRL